MSENKMYCDKGKVFVFILFIFLTLYNFLYNFHENKLVTPSPFQDIAYVPRNIVDGINCHFPNLKSFDKAISQFVFNEKPVDCTADRQDPYKLLFDVDGKGTLVKVGREEDFHDNICCYRPFDPRKEKPETTQALSNCSIIEETYTTIPPDVEFLGIYCTRKSDDESSMSPELVDLLYSIPLKSEVEARVEEIENKRQRSGGSEAPPRVNVVIFGIDSVSHLNFQRTMPLTREYLLNKMSASYLNGYTKVSDNTFSNLVPVFTGHNVDELREECWPTKESHFDACQFIWEKYRDVGYRTAYGEDAVWMGIFNYEKRGFQNPPTDYYLNNLMSISAGLVGHWKNAAVKLCYGPRLGFSILLNYLEKMAVKMNHVRRYFHFIWATSISHDLLNYPAMVDTETQKTIQVLHEGEYFNNTVFIFMSDHGIRYGEIRETFQGKVEENMPFLYIVFPPWFEDVYPLVLGNLKLNHDKLTTPFDLHEMLVDLHNLNALRETEVEKRQLRLNVDDFPRGISLFLSIPKNRTCEHARVPDPYCVCHAVTPIPVNSPGVSAAAAAAVETLNGLLSPYSECAELSLSIVLSAHSVDFSGSRVDLLRAKPVEYVIIFKTRPGEAVFEATVLSTTRNILEESAWKLAGEMSRVNAYGNQSHCVDDYVLKKYCFCQ